MTVKNSIRPHNKTSKIEKAYRLFRNYGVDRLMGKPSTASFWWLPELTRVKDDVSYQNYLTKSDPSPLYLMNYAHKLSYSYQNEDNIIVLPYKEPIGDQINPEAAFIYALAVHDDFLIHNQPSRRDEFLHYASYFQKSQTPTGDWHYLFDWPGSPAPWTSALAQGRGASVMVRAWMLTKDERYKEAAQKAVANFGRPIKDGGYQALHHLTGQPYYEEYPGRPIGVVNGFMASLLGCWEVAHWTKDETAQKLFDQGIDSLINMTPHYLVNGWSVYDKNPDIDSPNYNTPRYHRLVLSYFEILSILSGHKEIMSLRDEWGSRLGFFNEKRALVLKFIWKLKYGVFSS